MRFPSIVCNMMDATINGFACLLLFNMYNILVIIGFCRNALAKVSVVSLSHSCIILFIPK